MKILVIGSSGQIGYEVCRLLSKKAIVFYAPKRAELDLAEPKQIQQTLKVYQPDFVINCAAYNNPVQAENEPSRCFNINRDATTELADHCHQQGIKLIHISSYRVFDGNKQEAYNESDATNPIGVLGTSRLQAEQQIRERCPQHIILRLSWIISNRRLNMLNRMVGQMLTNKEISVAPDQLGCPTPANDAARVIVAILQQLSCGASPWGTYHYASAESVSESGFAEILISEASHFQDLKVRKLVMEKMDAREGIKPPANASLDNTKILNTFGIHSRPWRNVLPKVIQQLYEEQTAHTAAKNKPEQQKCPKGP